MIEGKIFDIKQFAVHDGPGIRTTVFFKGCPLSCPWCHNPEGIYYEDDLFFYETKCIGCGSCLVVCPQDAVKEKNEVVTLDRDKCDLCGKCASECPTTALKMVGKKVTVEEVMKEIERSTVYHDTSDGGVTLSGGEPFQQFEFMRELIDRCKEKDIHVTVDTCGHVKPDKFDSIKGKIDLFLFDLKIIDDELHKEYTGVSNNDILDNLKSLLRESDNEVIIRFPVIPGITDTEENISSILDFLSSPKRVKEIDLLPYHDVKEKYNRLGKKYVVKRTKAPSRDKVEEIKRIFESEGYRVKEGG
ncbi:MAG: glycyl-radical enzyme activating protein [Candidatus Thermoplasmatota archaeon]|nr:glycyl-radical enzyme activating protein [Candidatus Thermoplasmatota archaeon]